MLPELKLFSYDTNHSLDCSPVSLSSLLDGFESFQVDFNMLGVKTSLYFTVMTSVRTPFVWTFVLFWTLELGLAGKNKDSMNTRGNSNVM